MATRPEARPGLKNQHSVQGPAAAVLGDYSTSFSFKMSKIHLTDFSYSELKTNHRKQLQLESSAPCSRASCTKGSRSPPSKIRRLGDESLLWSSHPSILTAMPLLTAGWLPKERQIPFLLLHWENWGHYQKIISLDFLPFPITPRPTSKVHPVFFFWFRANFSTYALSAPAGFLKIGAKLK